MKDQEDVTLSNLAGGGVVERFDDELKVVLKNMQDPNTTLGVREVNLKVKIKPDQNRDIARLTVEVSSKLAPATPLETTVFVAETKDGAVATEYNPKQPVLPEISSNVTSIRSIGGGNK